MNEENLGYIKKETLVEIADAIRNKTGKTEEIQVENLANEINDIQSEEIPESINTDLENEINKLENRLNGGQEIESVYDQIYDEGYNKGTEDGEKAEYDAFWDEYLKYAKTTGIGAYLFSGVGWGDNTFNLPYNIDFVTNAYGLFCYARNIPKEKIRRVDFSKITKNFVNLFANSSIKQLPSIDTRGCSEIYGICNECKALISFEELVLREDGTQTLTSLFNSCIELQHLRVSGVIGVNGFNTKWSPLDKESLTSIVNALSSTTTGLTVTLRLSAVNNAFETAEGFSDGSTSEEWQSLIATKPNWTISLA